MTIYKDEFIKNAAIKGLELDLYKYIRDNYKKVKLNSEEGKEFRKKYNHFFKIRRAEEWRKVYYDYFEKNKNKNVTFKDIITYIYENTSDNCIEPSFASKMLSIIDPNMPVWDRYVMENLGIIVPNTYKEYDLDDIIKKYDELCDKVNEILNNPDDMKEIEIIKDEFKKYNLTNTKVIDYFMWCKRS